MVSQEASKQRCETMSIRDKVIDAIKSHVCTRPIHNFPKNMAAQEEKQFKVKNLDEVFDVVEKYKDSFNIYCRQYSEYQINNDKYDKIYIDIDSETNLKKAHSEMQLINNYLKNYFLCFPRTYFSGNKGFAIYIDFPEIEINYDKIRWFTESLRNTLKLKYIDIKVTKDNKRISRLPYTINYSAVKLGKKTKMVVPVKPTWSLHKILDEAKHVTFDQEVVIDKSKLIASVIKNVKPPKYTYKHKGKHSSIDHLTTFNLSSIVELLENAYKLTNGRKRMLYYHIVPTLVRENLNDDMIHAVCNKFITKSGKNYSEYKLFVDTHIRRNREHNFVPKSSEDVLWENPDIVKDMKK